MSLSDGICENAGSNTAIDTDIDMKTIALINQKGGVGKTTIATGLAVEMEKKGKRTLVIDADPQQNVVLWGQRRDSDRPVVTTCPVSLMGAEITRAGKKGFSYAIIDTPGVAEQVSFDIAKVADLIVIPVNYSMYDLDSTLTTIQMVHQLKIPHLMIVNGIRPNSPRKFDELKAALETNYRATVYPKYLASRVAHADCAGLGLGVREHEPKGKAADEIGGLYTYIRKHFAKTQRGLAA